MGLLFCLGPLGQFKSEELASRKSIEIELPYPRRLGGESPPPSRLASRAGKRKDSRQVAILHASTRVGSFWHHDSAIRMSSLRRLRLTYKERPQSRSYHGLKY